MTARARIVVIRDPAGDLARLLEARPERPQVDVAPSLFDALEQTLDDPPETLFHDGSLDDPEEVGALRVLRLALPNLRLVLLGPRDREFELSALAERLRAGVLTRPFDRRAVAAALGQTDPGDGRPPGIYKRIVLSADEHRLLPIVVFPQRAARYEPRFDFYALGRRVVERDFNRLLAANFEQAKRTAKR